MRNTSGIFVALFVAGFLLLSACGQKGPLFIPDEQPLDKPQTEKTTKNS